MSTPNVAADPTIADFKPAVDQTLKTILAAARARAQTIDETYGALIEVASQSLLAGGKRLRPYLSYLAYTGLGGADRTALLPAAASQELLHYFLLTHDDIIDRDVVRHGRANLIGTYRDHFADRGFAAADAVHYAESYALLAGNAICALALETVAATSFGPRRKLQALQCIQTMLFDIMGGELADVDSSLGRGPVSTERLLQICHYKTATYSFQTPLQVGAILAGASATVQRCLRDFGRLLGIAFQLTDDLLGVYGDEAKLGKPVTSDLREGKQTLLIHYAFASATPAQARTLRRLWGKRTATQGDLATVRQILHDCGAQAKVAALATSQCDDSLSLLDRVPLAAPAKTELIHLAYFCINREY